MLEWLRDAALQFVVELTGNILIQCVVGLFGLF